MLPRSAMSHPRFSTKRGFKHMYYCGNFVGMDQLPGSDGHCGPDDGPQCASCIKFQAKYYEDRYAEEEAGKTERERQEAERLASQDRAKNIAREKELFSSDIDERDYVSVLAPCAVLALWNFTRISGFPLIAISFGMGRIHNQLSTARDSI